MARRRRKRPSAKSEDKTQVMRTTASDADGLNALSSTEYLASSDCFSEEGGKRQKLEQRQEEATDKNGEQERGGEETDPPQDDLTLLPSVIYPKSEGQPGHSLCQRSHPEEGEEENESPILVTCDRNEGRLYLSKLRVVVNERCRTKCIRTGSTWWTPNEFQFVSGRGAAKDWKRTVKHNGHCLKTLLTNGTIRLNAIPPKCFCKSCEHTVGNHFIRSYSYRRTSLLLSGSVEIYCATVYLTYVISLKIRGHGKFRYKSLKFWHKITAIWTQFDADE